MEDLPPRRLEALSAHLEGLEAALSALDSDDTAEESLRRIARSLGTAAEADGAAQIAALASAIVVAASPGLAASTRDLLDYVAAMRRQAPPSDIHVLVVEDNRTVAAAVQAYLSGPGRRLHHSMSAAEAEALLQEHPIDIVVLDLILPDRDGRDLLVQLREDPLTADLPVVVLSAKAGVVAKAECLAVGASEFLEKPPDPATLRAAVTRHVRERIGRARSRTDPGTGLLNRAGLIEAYRAARAHAPDALAAVGLLAVNELGEVTDASGGAACDDLLRTLATEIRKGCEDRDVVGRWGPAQLVALFPGSSTGDAEARLKSVLDRIVEDDALRAYREGGASVSFGAGVTVARPGDELREAVSTAEHSLCRAKTAGKAVVLGSPDRGAGGCRPRVLLVEDDKVTATLIHHRLRREGFEVMDFLNGEDAHRWASESSFDLAILDVKVPGMDGFELLETLRAMPHAASVPIVMLTGLGSEADVIRGLELGANDYMLKPFSPTELLARVRRLIHGRGRRGAPPPSTSDDRAEAGAR